MTEDQEKRLRAAEALCITQRNEPDLWLDYGEHEPEPLQPGHLVAAWRGPRGDVRACESLAICNSESFEHSLAMVLDSLGVHLQRP